MDLRNLMWSAKISYVAPDRYVALPMRLRHGMHVNGAGRHRIPVSGSGTPEVSRASTGSNFSGNRVRHCVRSIEPALFRGRNGARSHCW
jgi:hypothetical protein